MNPRITEQDAFQALHDRYGIVRAGARRFAVAEHVRDNNGYGGHAYRIADFFAVDSWGSGGFAIHGHEIKVTRSDWLSELKKPEKAAVFTPYVHHWWLVAPTGVAAVDELPEGWGMMVVKEGTVRVKVQAPQRDAMSIPLSMLAALLRSTAATAVRQAAATFQVAG